MELRAESSFVGKLPPSGNSQMVYEKRSVIMLKQIFLVKRAKLQYLG